jgi:hypothetical protein
MTCYWAAKIGIWKLYNVFMRMAVHGTKELAAAAAAAAGRHLESLKYAHDNGCPWSKETCWHTALEDQLETLKYLHENGCPWNKHTSVAAALLQRNNWRC